MIFLWFKLFLNQERGKEIDIVLTPFRALFLSILFLKNLFLFLLITLVLGISDGSHLSLTLLPSPGSFKLMSGGEAHCVDDLSLWGIWNEYVSSLDSSLKYSFTKLREGAEKEKSSSFGK